MSEIIDDKVAIFDTTLRDGEQTRGVAFTAQDKLAIATDLDLMGVDVIEAGFPIASDGEFEAVNLVASSIKNTTIAGLCRTSFDDIDRAWEAIEPAKYNGGARIHTFIATSEIQMKKKLKMTPEQVIKAISEAVGRAREYTDNVEFSPEDASRSDFNFMIRAIKTAVDNGATTINVPDTVGYAVPRQYQERIQEVRKQVPGDYLLSVHCHNDLGMAVANSLAGIEGGARQVEGTMTGIGERAGNGALEEIIMALDTRKDYYGLRTDIDTTMIGPVSKKISVISGIAIPPNKAIIGWNAFSHAAGIHQAGVKNDKETYEIMDESNVGIDSETFPISKLSGSGGLVKRAEAIGFDITRVKSSAGKAADRWCDANAREATDVDIENFIADFLGIELEDKIRMVEPPQFKMVQSKASATLNIEYMGVNYEGEYSVDGGTIEALIGGVKAIADVSCSTDDFKAVGIDHGASSRALVTMTVVNGDSRVTSSAVHGSVDQATVDAYMNGINTILRSKERISTKDGIETPIVNDGGSNDVRQVPRTPNPHMSNLPA